MSARSDNPVRPERILERAWGRRATLAPLAGEVDRNFLVSENGSRRAVLKMKLGSAASDDMDFQVGALNHLATQPLSFAVPEPIATRNGDPYHVDDTCCAWLVDYLDGEVLAEFTPHTPALLESLGSAVAEVGQALAEFRHPGMRRGHQWELTEAARHRAGCRHVARQWREQVSGTLDRFTRDIEPRLAELPWGVIHNDANDHNVLVDGDPTGEPRLCGLLDPGDMSYQPLVCDLAIACAYAALDKTLPLAAILAVVRGYARQRHLSEREVALLFDLITTRLSVSIVISCGRVAAGDEAPYTVISQAPAARALLALCELPRVYVQAALRLACGLEALPHSGAVIRSLAAARPVIDDAPGSPVLDLSAGSLLLGADPDNVERVALTEIIDREMARCGATTAFGRYAEPRLLYNVAAFGSHGMARRTVHLGIDVFCAVGTQLRAPLEAVVHRVANNTGRLDYGPLVILRHQTDTGETFFSLYGHLELNSVRELEVGQRLGRGAAFARVGAPPENGDWPPHVHAQLILDLAGLSVDFPGVCTPDDRDVWLALSPNPAMLVGADVAEVNGLPDDDRMRARRARLLGANLRLSYRRPLHVVRGFGQYLYDSFGREYLDVYNNVAHVGHCHPRVVDAVSRQTALLNTNTRYLHRNILDYAERLTATLPPPLAVCYFVNSASEANELALRLARAATGRRDMLVVQAAYHGHTSALIDLSPYKYSGPGGEGQAAWVHEVPLPDPYRHGREHDTDAGAWFADFVRKRLGSVAPAGFIAETLPSVGGQIVPPPGYLQRVYELVRAAGGVTIADEVQTGFGRLGRFFWGFEQQKVVPDIVVLGKPIANGYPLGAVITTREIARAFDGGMEYFSTFGGNPVACAAGLAVLDVLREERLAERAAAHGDYLMSALGGLKVRHEIVGDVRGLGLFLGLELVADRETKQPAPRAAAWVVNRLRERNVLVGTDGPHHNVVKLRPSMVAVRADHERLVETLDAALGESACALAAAADGADEQADA